MSQNTKKKRRRKQKGFTLIELMAVLAILAMLMLIAVPAVGNILAKAERDTAAINAKMIEKAAQMAYASGLPFDEILPNHKEQLMLEEQTEDPDIYYTTTLLDTGLLSATTEESSYDPESYVRMASAGTFEFNTFRMASVDTPIVPQAPAEPFVWETSGIKTWTVPVTGRYLVEVSGAQGGDGGATGEGYSGPGETGLKGDYAKTEIVMDKDTVLTMRVGGKGGKGGTGKAGGAGGGGGGSSNIQLDASLLLSAKGGKGGQGGKGVIAARYGIASGGYGGYSDGTKGGSITTSGKSHYGGAGGGTTVIGASPMVDATKNATQLAAQLGQGRIAITFVSFE